MKKLNFGLILAITAACTSIKINQAPDAIPIISDGPLIEYNLVHKEATYRFKYLKKKSDRLPILKEIQSLSKLGLEQFQEAEMNTTKYSEFAELARIGTQFVMWLSILENQSEMAEIVDKPSVQQIVSQLKENKLLIPLAQAYETQSDDPILQISIALRDALNTLLNS